MRTLVMTQEATKAVLKCLRDAAEALEDGLTCGDDPRNFIEAVKAATVFGDALLRAEKTKAGMQQTADRKHENQESITSWERETFGEIQRGARELKLADEMAELTKSLRDGDDASIRDELADVAIVMCEVASDHGISIRDAVDAKMARNRLRKWRRTEAGNFQHVEEGK